MVVCDLFIKLVSGFHLEKKAEKGMEDQDDYEDRERERVIMSSCSKRHVMALRRICQATLGTNTSKVSADLTKKLSDFLKELQQVQSISWPKPSIEQQPRGYK